MGPAGRAPPGSVQRPRPELRALRTSPSIPARWRKPRALATHPPTVAASLRQGMRMVSSIIPFPTPKQKKGTPKGTFYEANSLLLAAAGAGQRYRVEVGTVAGRSAAPANKEKEACRYPGRHCGAR